MAQDKLSDILAKHLVVGVKMNKLYFDEDNPNSMFDRMTPMTRIGSLLLQEGRRREAYRCFIMAYTERQDDFWAKFYLGSMLLEINNPAGANYFLRACLEEVPETWSERPVLLSNLASCQFKLGDFSGAEASLEEAIALSPALDTPYYMQAVHHIYLGNPEQALSNVKKGQEKSPNSYLLKHLELEILEMIEKQKDNL